MPLFSEPVLALDTSAGASVCLTLPSGQAACTRMSAPRAHSRELLPLLVGLLHEHDLNWSDIGAFAVGTGPGSFTGLRVACAMIAGLNASLNKPVYALSSLAITAKQADAGDTPLWALEDARSGLVYAAQYQGDTCLRPPVCIRWDELQNHEASAYVSLSDIPVSLSGWQALPVRKSREQALLESVRALNPDDKSGMWVEPLYLQPSQAEKNLV